MKPIGNIKEKVVSIFIVIRVFRIHEKHLQFHCHYNPQINIKCGNPTRQLNDNVT